MKEIKEKIIKIIEEAIITSVQGGIIKDIAITRTNKILELFEAREKEILEIINNSRTTEEQFGIGKKEDQARQQVIADILSKP